MVLQDLVNRQPWLFIVSLGVIFALIEWGLLLVERRMSYGCRVTERSSHNTPTPTAGGIIWMLAAIAGMVIFGNLHSEQACFFLGGTIVLGIISFIDDIHPLPPVPRLISQILVMGLTFKHLANPHAFDIYLLVLFCGVGIINAINFLDGICGMLALYGLVVTGSLLYGFYAASLPEISWFIPVLIMVLTAQVVFTCFNLKDLIFAGDVGSITLGWIQVFAALTLILTTRDGVYLVFFAVCVFDTGLTTLQRLFAGERILQPHRKNIYQLLTSAHNLPHLTVSIAYASLQLIINVLFFIIPTESHSTYLIIVSAGLITTYFAIRSYFRQRH